MPRRSRIAEAEIQDAEIVNETPAAEAPATEAPSVELDENLPVGIHATEVPDATLPWVRQIMELSGNAVIEEAKATWPRLKQESWRFALLIGRIYREGLFRPYDSLTEWARHELGKDSGSVSKYRSAAEYLCTLPAEEATAVMEATPPATLAEAGIHQLARKQPEEALRLAKSGKTQRDLKHHVRVRQAEEQHLDVDGFRTFRVTVGAPAYRKLVECLHLTRFLCMNPHPTDTEIIEMIAVEFQGAAQIQPEALEKIGGIFLPEEIDPSAEDFDRDSFTIRSALQSAGWAAIVAGLYKCVECGATNANMLEGHHTVPKSHQGHFSPQIPLCQQDHQRVTENWEDHWREHQRRWMGREDLDWYRARMERWLGGRTLEDIQ